MLIYALDNTPTAAQQEESRSQSLRLASIATSRPWAFVAAISHIITRDGASRIALCSGHRRTLAGLYRSAALVPSRCCSSVVNPVARL